MVRVNDFDRFVFVVGAPRCGTTTLSYFLKAHPSVRFPFVKEPHFFAQQDLRALSDQELRQRVEEDYLGRFFGSDRTRRTGAEGSVTYLYAPEQLEPILRLWPESRFVVAVRDPLAMLPSLHGRLIYIGDETIGRFDAAWAAVPARAAGRRIPRSCVDPRWLRYDQAARFGTYIRRLFDVVGRERCHVVVFDDLAANPGSEYRRLMRFVDLDPLPEIDLSAQRASSDVKIRWLQRLLKRPPNGFRRYFAGEKFQQRIQRSGTATAAAPSSEILALRKRLLRWNRMPPSPARIPPHLQNEIRAHFRGEIESLSRLLNRDLSHWLRPAVTSPSEWGERGFSVSPA